MRIAAVALAITAVAMAFSAPAHAQPSGDAWARCINLDEKFPAVQAIAACTALIDSGKLEQGDLAIAHYDRANGHFIRKDWSRAIADYDAAIRLDPAD
jgi:hypothetical protein